MYVEQYNDCRLRRGGEAWRGAGKGEVERGEGDDEEVGGGSYRCEQHVWKL